jgi:hypothetical protein
MGDNKAFVSLTPTLFLEERENKKESSKRLDSRFRGNDVEKTKKLLTVFE